MVASPGCPTGGGDGPEPEPGPDCNAITAAVGFAGLTYQNALKIWDDGTLWGTTSDSYSATIAALAAVTWQGESSFKLYPTNYGNKNANGIVTSIDYGPFQINSRWHPLSGQAIGTNGANQTFNGNPDLNIAAGISVLMDLYSQYGNAAAGHYVGSLGYNKDGTAINQSAQNRQSTWNNWNGALTQLFSNTDCFPHQ